jgi:uncharacterized protein (UPF0335 family)
MATKAKASAKKKPKVINGVNGITLEDVREYFDQVHGLHDELDEEKGRIMGQINEVYEKATTAFDVTKEALVMMFKNERKLIKDEKKARKMDSRSRDSMMKFSQAFGEGSPMGEWAARMARTSESEAARQGQQE